VRIRISRGVGSNPKLWAVGGNTQVGEFDISDEPGWEDADAMGGMTGIIWRNGGHPAEVLPRKLYADVEEWVSDIRAEYPDAVIIRADKEPQNWL
jgi:hypothetical protein